MSIQVNTPFNVVSVNCGSIIQFQKAAIDFSNVVCIFGPVFNEENWTISFEIAFNDNGNMNKISLVRDVTEEEYIIFQKNKFFNSTDMHDKNINYNLQINKYKSRHKKNIHMFPSGTSQQHIKDTIEQNCEYITFDPMSWDNPDVLKYADKEVKEIINHWISIKSRNKKVSVAL